MLYDEASAGGNSREGCRSLGSGYLGLRVGNVHAGALVPNAPNPSGQGKESQPLNLGPRWTKAGVSGSHCI